MKPKKQKKVDFTKTGNQNIKPKWKVISRAELMQLVLAQKPSKTA